jgi:biotin transport system substrate-specific component
MTIAVPRLSRIPSEQAGITIGDFLVPIRVGEPLSARARNLVLVVAGALFIYLLTQVRILLPDNPVPISGQTLGVLLVGGALGLRRGFAAISLYVVLGLAGLPLFAAGRGGLEVLQGATGGYLVGFIVAGALVGRLAELGWDRRLGVALLAMAIGNAVIYMIALPWYAYVANLDAATVLERGLAPYVLVDLVKLAAAAALFPAAWWVVGRRPHER